MSAQRMGALLGRWVDGDEPLHQSLTSALTRVIDRGEIPAETLLPTERELASELGVSRTTVVTAYRTLKLTGKLASRQGRGTWIPAAASAARAGTAARVTPELFGSMLAADDRHLIDLTAACPLPSPVLVSAVRELTGADMAEGMTGRGYLPAGLPALRAAIAERYTAQGLPTAPEQIVVTNGGQQAIALTVSLLVSPDAAVVTEDPTYPGALDQLRGRGARILGVPVDDGGMVVDGLEGLVAHQRPALMYLVPSFHNPTGCLLAPDRGERIAEVSARTGVPVIEDEILRDIWIQGRRPGPYLAAHRASAPIITIGSLSKTLWGGLRLGWLRAPRSLAERLAQMRLMADLGGPIPMQALALRLMPLLDEAAVRRRELVRRAADAAMAEMALGLPEWEVSEPLGGATLWPRMPWGDARSFAQAALRAGVVILPGPAMSTTGGHADRMRLSLLGEPEELREGIRRLGAAWVSYQAAAHRPVIV
ncbi:MAG: PLP-dependent aminotransferase family protein [Thermoleophilia bacterium]